MYGVDSVKDSYDDSTTSHEDDSDTQDDDEDDLFNDNYRDDTDNELFLNGDADYLMHDGDGFVWMIVWLREQHQYGLRE
ncbi:hypothetical protein Tco_1422508 [Tanacetum coccineum]